MKIDCKRLEIPLLFQADIVFFEPDIKTIKMAAELSDGGKRVAVLSYGTCLAPEICSTFRYDRADEIREMVPPSVITRSGMIHPDRFKLFLEDFCLSHRIRIVYRVLPLQHDGHTLCLAAKGGIFAAACQEFHRGRTKTQSVCHYSAMIGGNAANAFSILSVTARRAELGDQESEAIALMQNKIVNAFQKRKLLDPSLQLGRFAPEIEGFGVPVPDCRWGMKKCSQKEYQLIDRCAHIADADEVLRTGNEFNALIHRPAVHSAWVSDAEEKKCQVLVVGGGTAGAMAALHAARTGAEVILAEQMTSLGGTATAGGVNSYWFGNRFLDVREIDELVADCMDYCRLDQSKTAWGMHDSWNPGIKDLVLKKMCARAGVHILFHRICCGTLMQGNRVRGALFATKSGLEIIHADFVMDATGDGDVCIYSGADSDYGTGRDCFSYWSSLAQYDGVSSNKNNFTFSLVESDPIDVTNFISRARKCGESLLDHGLYPAQRESRHIRTVRTVTLRDCMIGRRWKDGLYSCYSNYDPKGLTTADCVYSGVLPPQAKIQIPLSALIPIRSDKTVIHGLIVLGKAMGATHNAIPSIRMQADFMHQGTVAGTIAAYCVIHQISDLRTLSRPQIRKMLKKVTDDEAKIKSLAMPPAQAVRLLSAASRDQWDDYSFDQCVDSPSEVLTLLLAGPKACPLIREKMEEETSPEDWTGKNAGSMEQLPLRIRLLSFLLWYRKTSAEEEKEYADWIGQQLSMGLPVRNGPVVCVQMLPDHGIMPETVYRMNLLSRTGSKVIIPLYQKLLQLLQDSKRDYKSIRQGVYCYIDSFSYALEHSGQRDLIPMIHTLLHFPEFSEKLSSQDECIQERLKMLKLSLNRALIRFRDCTGYHNLCEMSLDPMLSVSVSAQMAIREKGKGRVTGNRW